MTASAQQLNRATLERRLLDEFAPARWLLADSDGNEADAATTMKRD